MAGLMSILHERFLDFLGARGWTVLRTEPGAAPMAAPAGSTEHAAFLSLCTQLGSGDDTPGSSARPTMREPPAAPLDGMPFAA